MKIKRIAPWILAAALLIVLIRLCLYTVPADQYAVITEFGKPGTIRSEAGLYFKGPAPFAIVNRIDKKLQSYQSALVEYLTGDKKNLLVQTYVFWRIREPLVFFQAIHDDESARQKIDDVVCSLVASTLGEYSMNQIISTEPDAIKIGEIIDKVSSSAAERINAYGIEIRHVGFSRIALPEDNTRSVYRRMIAERSTIANEYRALGRQRASEIRTDADRERSDILAVAYRDAEIIRGRADAEAAETYGQAYSKYPELYRFLRTLETEQKIMGDRTTLVLSMDSDLFAPLAENQIR